MNEHTERLLPVFIFFGIVIGMVFSDWRNSNLLLGAFWGAGCGVFVFMMYLNLILKRPSFKNMPKKKQGDF